MAGPGGDDAPTSDLSPAGRWLPRNGQVDERLLRVASQLEAYPAHQHVWQAVVHLELKQLLHLVLWRAVGAGQLWRRTHVLVAGDSQARLLGSVLLCHRRCSRRQPEGRWRLNTLLGCRGSGGKRASAQRKRRNVCSVSSSISSPTAKFTSTWRR